MKRTICLSLVVALGGWSLLAGCGNGITDTESPELAVLSSTNEYQLQQMGPRDRDRTLPSLELENVGPGTMEITKIEWVSRPDRLHGYYSGANSTDGGVCSTDSDCGSDAFCLSASGACRDLGFAPQPIEVLTGRRHTLNFVLTQSSQPVQCPEAHEEVPEDIVSRYCGELVIETNATNDAQSVENGNARIYFVTDGTSGLMSLSESFVRFTEVAPGGTYTRTFSINNDAAQPLTVERATYTNNANWFSISPNIANTTIEGNGSQSFTLEMNVPLDVGLEDLEFGTSVNFASSSAGTSPSMFVEVTAGLGDVPVIEVTPGQLSFVDSDSQTFEIRNYGGGTLIVTRIDLNPSSLEDVYRVLYEGNEIDLGRGGVPNLPRAGDDGPTVRELTVEFTAPADPARSTVATLEIRHNDTRTESPLRVQLLGDNADVALGEIGNQSTRQIRMVSDGGPQVRRLPLVNRGNADLVISDVEFDDTQSNTDQADYEVQVYENGSLAALEGLRLEPGEIRELVISYVGASQFAQTLGVELISNHAGQPGAMSFTVQAQTGSLSELEAVISPSFSTNAVVGQPTSFQLVLSGSGEGANSANNAQWMTLERPAGSTALVQAVGAATTFVPDQSGRYRILVQLRDDQNREIQTVLEFQAVE